MAKRQKILEHGVECIATVSCPRVSPTKNNSSSISRVLFDVPMKQLDLVYSPTGQELFLFNNLDLSKLVDPLTIEREVTMEAEVQVFEKKKSEIIEYEDEEYLQLKEKEQDPMVILDAEARSMCGKYQNVSDNASMYFAFINNGDYLDVVPISKWYGFVQRTLVAEGDVEGMEKSLGQTNIEVESDDSDSLHDIDYENVFDNDDGDFAEVYVEKYKTLSTSGKKMQMLVDSYEENRDRKAEKEVEEVVEEKKRAKVDKQEGRQMAEEDIRKAFNGKQISVKDLLLNLKAKFKMDDNEKVLIREYLREKCSFETDPITGEKTFRLKK